MDAVSSPCVSVTATLSDSNVTLENVRPSPIPKRYRVEDSRPVTPAEPAQSTPVSYNVARTKWGKLTKKQSSYVPKKSSKPPSVEKWFSVKSTLRSTTGVVTVAASKSLEDVN